MIDAARLKGTPLKDEKYLFLGAGRQESGSRISFARRSSDRE